MNFTSLARPLSSMTFNYDGLTNVCYYSPWQHFGTTAHSTQPVPSQRHHKNNRTMTRLHLWRLTTQHLKRLSDSPIVSALESTLQSVLPAVSFARTVTHHSVPLALGRLTDLHPQVPWRLAKHWTPSHLGDMLPPHNQPGVLPLQ